MLKLQHARSNELCLLLQHYADIFLFLDTALQIHTTLMKPKVCPSMGVHLLSLAKPQEALLVTSQGIQVKSSTETPGT